MEEDGKYYPMMKAVHAEEGRPETRPWSRVELLYGRDLLARRHPVLRDYLLRERRIREEILLRLEKAGTPGALLREKEVDRELEEIREALDVYEGKEQ